MSGGESSKGSRPHTASPSVGRSGLSASRALPCATGARGSCRRNFGARIKERAAERPRWGCRRIHLLLRREGWTVNRKRVERLYRAEGLAVRRRGKRRRSQVPRLVRDVLGRPNERWSLDFVSDSLANGRTFRCLTVVDEFSRAGLAVHVAHSIPAVRVIEALEQLRLERGLPEVVITDNGSECTSRAFDSRAYARGVKISYIPPGKPVQNCYIESFNGTFRDECLNLHWFVSVADARRAIEAWRADYNRVRPHSSLGYLTPEEFVEVQSQSEEVLASTINPPVPQ
ncbi:MAG TPA: IS3 family transposase [Longimicrobiales bacterium]